ncbi:MAG: antitoxin [Desulfovermiculus sp.]|nr:antitoxin [Desulfovermiculus sp.]
MKHSIALLKADIREEISKLNIVVEEFRPLMPQLAYRDEQVSSYDKIVVGYLLHSFYNGCENIFRTVARFFENEVEPGSWHRDLLRRMKLEVPEYRPRLISDQLYRLLDDFRGFRHRFRHSYSFELDWEREKVVAGKLEDAFKLLQEDVNSFLEALDSLSEAE